jgi:RNA polymerase sigma factor (sigma-70 family)
MNGDTLTGNREQWREEIRKLFEKTHAAVYRALWASIGNASDTDDCLQDVYLALLEAEPPKDINEFRKNPKGYLYRAAMNRAKDLHRWRGRQRVANVLVESLSNEHVGTDPRVPALRQALAQMDEDVVALLYLAYVDEVPCKEIAEMQGRSVGYVYLKLARAKYQVRKLMGIQENEHETKKDERQRSSTGSAAEAFEG